MSRLPVLDERISARVDAVHADRPAWPCTRGCAGCCRTLAAPPIFSAAEWARLERGLAALPEAEAAEIRARLDRLPESADADGHYTCPFLGEGGDCRVYAHRPLLCRAYGYYAARGGGMWCADIEAAVQAGLSDGVVLGNYDALDAEARRDLGEALDWAEWRQR